MRTCEMAQWPDLVACARTFVHAPVAYQFTELERRALEPFFTNTTKKVFLMSGLPESVAATLLAMYSRLKNPRGLRGHFVDNLVPVLMATDLIGEGREFATTKEFNLWRGNNSLDKVRAFSPQAMVLFEEFVGNAAQPEYWRKIATSPRIQEFKSDFLDKYGHKSIMRPARLIICMEDVSMLAAKTVEWTWPGTGFIELSTRFVDFSRKSQYPIWDELALINAQAGRMAQSIVEASCTTYQRLIGERLDGPFPRFLRERWGTLVPEKSLDACVQGEACDVLGNLLPCSTLTQLGIGISGEALGPFLKNLRLDCTPENAALAELIVSEVQASGNGYFIRHDEPTPWDIAGWRYLPTISASGFDADSRSVAEDRIARAFGEFNMEHVMRYLRRVRRGDHDMLPDKFRVASALRHGSMSFRSWRDLQRQSLCVHARSRVTPLIGFYGYPKSAPPEVYEAFTNIWKSNGGLFSLLCEEKIAPELREYPMAMGNLVSYQMSGDLKELEFSIRQRTQWGVNDEVRGEFLDIEYRLREQYPWWRELSRADTTPHYVFARGAAVPLPLPEDGM